jgi:hypothetical protein
MLTSALSWQRRLAMKFRVLTLVVTGAALSAMVAAGIPIAVSPGATSRIAATENPCPTFSWGLVPGAKMYELAVYDTEEGSSSPVLQERLPGSAQSWTPDLERCLPAGRAYAWSVRAIVDEVATTWSEPALFEVVKPDPRKALAVLEDYLERGGRLADLIGEDSTAGAPAAPGAVAPAIAVPIPPADALNPVDETSGSGTGAGELVVTGTDVIGDYAALFQHDESGDGLLQVGGSNVSLVAFETATFQSIVNFLGNATFSRPPKLVAIDTEPLRAATRSPSPTSSAHRTASSNAIPSTGAISWSCVPAAPTARTRSASVPSSPTTSTTSGSASTRRPGGRPACSTSQPFGHWVPASPSRVSRYQVEVRLELHPTSEICRSQLVAHSGASWNQDEGFVPRSAREPRAVRAPKPYALPNWNGVEGW